jgi:hypothetical protein
MKNTQVNGYIMSRAFCFISDTDCKVVFDFDLIEKKRK